MTRLISRHRKRVEQRNKLLFFVILPHIQKLQEKEDEKKLGNTPKQQRNSIYWLHKKQNLIFVIFIYKKNFKKNKGNTTCYNYITIIIILAMQLENFHESWIEQKNKFHFKIKTKKIMPAEK